MIPLLNALYRIKPSDLQQTVPAWYPRRGSNSNTATTVAHFLSNDTSNIWAVSAIGMRVAPGAAQNVTSMAADLRKPDDTVNFYLYGDTVAAGVAQPKVLGWTGFILVPPLWRLVATGTFNAGAASNQMELCVFGFLVPKGTLLF